jgi:hypothetical protein
MGSPASLATAAEEQVLLSPASVRAVQAEVAEVDCEPMVAQVQVEARVFRASLNLKPRLIFPTAPSAPRPGSAWLLGPLNLQVRPKGLGLGPGPLGLNSNLLPSNATQLVASALTASEPACWRLVGAMTWRRASCRQKAAEKQSSVD